MVNSFNNSGLQKNYPVLNKEDIVVIEMRDYPDNATVTLTALTAGVQVDFEARPDIDGLPDADGLPAPVATDSKTLAQAGFTETVTLPVGGADAINRVTRILVISGQVTLDISADKPYTDWIEQPASPPRILP